MGREFSSNMELAAILISLDAEQKEIDANPLGNEYALTADRQLIFSLARQVEKQQKQIEHQGKLISGLVEAVPSVTVQI